MDKAAKLAHEFQKAWMHQVSVGDEKAAVVLSQVVDAIFANLPGLAIERARLYGMDERIILAIRDAFDLTSDGGGE